MLMQVHPSLSRYVTSQNKAQEAERLIGSHFRSEIAGTAAVAFSSPAVRRLRLRHSRPSTTGSVGAGASRFGEDLLEVSHLALGLLAGVLFMSAQHSQHQQARPSCHKHAGARVHCEGCMQRLELP